MKAVKAIYEEGKITLSEEPAENGPVEVLVVFPDEAADPWQAILDEPAPRASFLEFAKQCEEEIKLGKAQPLNLDDL